MLNKNSLLFLYEDHCNNFPTLAYDIYDLVNSQDFSEQIYYVTIYDLLGNISQSIISASDTKFKKSLHEYSLIIIDHFEYIGEKHESCLYIYNLLFELLSNNTTIIIGVDSDFTFPIDIEWYFTNSYHD